MRADGAKPTRITRTNFIHMYWTFAQMLTHHMSNGCNLQPGDLLGSGTTSGPLDENRACLNELTNRGTHALALPNGETRGYLVDGDEVIFRGRAKRNGFVSNRLRRVSRTGRYSRTLAENRFVMKVAALTLCVVTIRSTPCFIGVHPCGQIDFQYFPRQLHARLSICMEHGDPMNLRRREIQPPVGSNASLIWKADLWVANNWPNTIALQTENSVLGKC